MHENEISEMVHAAVARSDVAYDLAKAVDNHLSTIARSVEALRSENTAQHSENRTFIAEQLGQIHTRVSSIKATQELNRVQYSDRMGGIEKTMSLRFNAMADAMKDAKHENEIDKVRLRSELKDGDQELEGKAKTKAIHVLWALAAVLLAVVAGVVSHGQVQLP